MGTRSFSCFPLKNQGVTAQTRKILENFAGNLESQSKKGTRNQGGGERKAGRNPRMPSCRVPRNEIIRKLANLQGKCKFRWSDAGGPWRECQNMTTCPARNRVPVPLLPASTYPQVTHKFLTGCPQTYPHFHSSRTIVCPAAGNPAADSPISPYAGIIQ